MEVSEIDQPGDGNVSSATRQWAEEMWEVFDRGVKAAIAENERLGIIVKEDADYGEIPADSSLKVAEGDGE